MEILDFVFLAVFLPALFVGYCIFQKWVKVQNLLILLGSLAFYASYGFDNVAFLLFSILITYFGGMIGSGLSKNHRKAGKAVHIISLLLNFGMLFVFKYAGFIGDNINSILGKFEQNINFPELLLPIGLSFFVFQSSTYILDLMQNKTVVEKNIIDFALFVSFFPTIISGPIQRSTVLLPQIKVKREIRYTNFQKAVYLFLWGAFMKFIIADRIALFTNEVFGNSDGYRGLVLILSAVAYSVQIYADFAGYSYMATGCATLFGFNIRENFRQPYLATSIADFWRRWHISLTSWFRDYLYIPLGGNRKGNFRKYLNVLIVFLVSGLWHGAEWSFVIWGAIHAIYQIAGSLTLKKRQKLCSVLKIDRNTTAYRMWQRLCVFVMTTFAWVFFRAGSLGTAIKYIAGMFTGWKPWTITDGTLFNVGIEPIEWNILFISVLVLVIVSVYRERGKTCDDFVKINTVFRYAICLVLIIVIVVFGIYGAEYSDSAFIYAGF
ncbi:MAG: MBOAT family protein [Clostridia bacterium]|nr:MBOAT family protein [Clostridia bacterium]